MLPMMETRTPKPFLRGVSDEITPSLSHDSRYVAYTSNESGRWEVYVVRFPSGEGRNQVSKIGGVLPRWRENELFYIENNTMMSVAVDTRFGPGIPQPLFTSDRARIQLHVSPSYSNPPADLDYDVTRDGQRFGMTQELGNDETPTITFVQNWFKDFEGRN
ncbi:MAG TPA: hypothetical protein DIT99_20770 [Candidatus Latescibacteria bacterium]|nr:hypothetical protein [Candidatus Latescibacterota bacterium]